MVVAVCLSVHVTTKLLSPLSDFKQFWQKCNYIPTDFVKNNRPDSRDSIRVPDSESYNVGSRLIRSQICHKIENAIKCLICKKSFKLIFLPS